MKVNFVTKRRVHRMLGAVGALMLTVPALRATAPALGSPNASGSAATAPAPGALGSFTFRDIGGKTYGRDAIAAHQATVFLFISSQCPISNLYTPRFLTLAADYGKQGVQVFAVYANTQESLGEITRHARERGLTFPVVRDGRAALAEHLGAKVTPQAVVVDSTGAVRYRGRIDDNAVATKVTERDLNDALDAVLQGRPVAHAQVPAFGCAIRRAPAPTPAAPGVPTYAKDIAPILRARCESCHRPGEVGPFSLQTYSQASAWAPDIQRYTQNGQMPPWKPAPDYGDFRDEAKMRLSDRELTTLAAWAEAGAPLGDAKQVPPPRHFAQGWQLGQPDVVLMPEQAYHLAAEGSDVYRNFIIKTDFAEDRYVSAVEVRPGNRAVVHHVINYIDGLGASAKLEGQDHDGQPGYTTFGGPGFLPTGSLGGWAPGNDPYFLPDGVAMRLPKGARLVLQVHYHKDGKPETDLTKIGLHFARKPVDKQIRYPFALNLWFQIPPNASHHEVSASFQIREDSHVLSVTPHMHLLGREMKIWATLPDGTEQPLVWIKDWDFNWQATYYLKEPVALPKGAKVHLTAYYDNSASNPRNPAGNRTRTVTWGEQTTDEMCIAFVGLTHDAEHLNYRPVNAPLKTAARK